MFLFFICAKEDLCYLEYLFFVLLILHDCLFFAIGVFFFLSICKFQGKYKEECFFIQGFVLFRIIISIIYILLVLLLLLFGLKYIFRLLYMYYCSYF